MKTLNHYQKLREDYACIISKNAPAWELIEALDDLIKLMQPKEDQSHFLGVPVNMPKGWGIIFNHDSNTITLTDHRGYRVAVAYQKINGNYGIWTAGKHETTLNTQKDAIEWLCDKANKS